MTQLTNDQKLTMIDLAVQGVSQRKIAATLNVTKQSISKQLQAPAVKAKIQSIQQAIIDQKLSDSYNNLAYAIDTYISRSNRLVKLERDKAGKYNGLTTYDNDNNPIDRDVDKTMLDHGFRASRLVLQSAGILPTPAPSMFIQNVYNHTHTVNITPVLHSVLSQVLESLPGDNDNVIDLETMVDED